MEHGDHDGQVWAFRQRGYKDVLDAFELLEQDEEDLFASSPSRVKIVHPVFNSARLIAQEGGFTLHSDPSRPLEDLSNVPFDERSLDVDGLYKWPVPLKGKPALFRELSGLGISHRSLSPIWTALHEASGKLKCCGMGRGQLAADGGWRDAEPPQLKPGVRPLRATCGIPSGNRDAAAVCGSVVE